MAKKLLIFSLSLMALVFTACSSDSEDAMGTSGMHEYSVEEIQQIQKLQEEYGVSFTYPTKSKTALPSMQDIEDVCKIAASLQTSTKHMERKGNTFYNVNKKRLATRGFSQGKEYSGNEETYGGLGEYGYCYYSITWTNTTPTNCDVSIDVKSIYETNSRYSIRYKNYDTKFTGAWHVNYTIYFNIHDYRYNSDFETHISSSINLESHRH